jgi:multidrug efflux pump subunit AcrB
VAHEVKQKLAVLKREFPQGLISEIPFDTTKFVEQSIHEVYKTLYEAAFLVWSSSSCSCRTGARC